MFKLGFHSDFRFTNNNINIIYGNRPVRIQLFTVTAQHMLKLKYYLELWILGFDYWTVTHWMKLVECTKKFI